VKWKDNQVSSLVIVCVFLFVQVGSHQFKVSNGDSIFTERLKFCEVNDRVSSLLLQIPDSSLCDIMIWL